jgi:HEAT repeat protein
MAAYVAGQFESESALDDFLRLFKDKDKMVRTRAIGAVADACRDWSAAGKARVREAA